ncbi:MAG: trypsin-like peptidase domain-containing protein [Bacilli bacterium]|nr:trypsin-like peptidase domain-containing protein [Bacilli bacterium]
MSEKIKEVEVEEEEVSTSVEKNKKEKKKSRAGLYFIGILFLLLIAVAFVIALNNVGLLRIDDLKTSKPRAELSYTQTNSKIKEGIYMTDVSEVVEEVMPSIVAITSKTLVKSGMFGPFYNQERYSEGAGSGIIVSKNDDELLILTNNHVIEGASELSVQFVNEKNVDATVKGTSERKDVAVIAVKIKDLDDATIESIKIATLGDSNALKVGNGIIAIGNALGYGQSVTTGVVSALNREVTIDDVKSKMIQIDAAINGGNSGGALLNSSGEVVGINSAKYSSSVSSTSASIEGMGFAIPISDVKDLITSLMNGEEDKSDAVIGIEGYIITEAQSEAYHMPVGFYISKITEGSGADKANLEIGNIVTAINGNKVTSLSDFTDVLSTKKKGDKVTLKISYVKDRSYQEKEVDVTLS